MNYFLKFPLEDTLGGGEFYTLNQAKQLAARGEGAKLITSDRHLFRLFEKARLARKRIFLGWEPTSKWSLLLWPQTYFIARSRLKKIVNDAPAGSTFYCQSLTEKLILPALLTTYNLPLTTIFVEHKIPGRWLKLNPLKFRYLKFAKKIKIITVSNFAKQEFVNLGVPKDNIEVVYPVPTSLSRRGEGSRERSNEFTIGILGRLDKEKGVLDFLKILLPHLPNHPDWKILIAGDGPQRPAIERFIKEHSQTRLPAPERSDGGQVKLLGFVYDLDEFFSQISALAYPTKVAESYGMAAAEAISRGIPVVARSLGALPEIIQHGQNGFLVQKPEDWIAYLEKIN